MLGSGWYDQGLTALENENRRKLISNFLKAVEEDPQNEQAYSKLGGSYLMTGDVESAIYAFQNVTNLNPENGVAWGNIGYLYLIGKEKPDPVPALEALTKAVEVKTDDPGIWTNYGIAQLSTPTQNLHLNHSIKAIELMPDGSRAYYWKGITLSDLGQPEEALTAYEKAIELNPEFKDALYAKGIAESALGKFDEAEATFNQVLTIGRLL